jgi:GWxTD domain-containing protein
MKAIRIISCLIALLVLVSGSLAALQRPSKAQRQEEKKDYYKTWLDEDVVYIITADERAVFDKLTTEEEREQFIEQFWFRRDPDPRTPTNEFKEEHYRRIAYANDHFGSGRAGWKSDQGRIYIIHGKPDEIQDHFGGAYERPMYEGGGVTSTYPYQVWRYRRIDGLGGDIELEFVDKTLTGDYKLARDFHEKDAFANVPGIGLTLAEERGLAGKHDRFIRSGAGEYYPLLALRDQDRPFVRLERYAGVMRPQAIKHPDLKQIVEVDVSYSSVPFRLHYDYFRLNEAQCIVAVNVELANRHLTFVPKGDFHTAPLAIYGLVSSMNGEIIKEFEDDVATSVNSEILQRGLTGKSLYQKLLILEKGKKFKLNLVVKDRNSGKVGAITRAVYPPNYTTNELEISSLVLSENIQRLDRVPDADEMFVLGDVKIRPSLDRVFSVDRLMGSYVQVYNVGVDQQTLQPSLRIRYKLFREGNQLMEIVDEQGESIHFYSGQRVVLTRVFSPGELGAGKYRLLVEVHDRITNQSAMIGDEFEIAAAAARSAKQ